MKGLHGQIGRHHLSGDARVAWTGWRHHLSSDARDAWTDLEEGSQ